MIFCANVDLKTGSRSQTRFKFDPWEFDWLAANYQQFCLGPLVVSTWYDAAWPPQVITTKLVPVELVRQFGLVNPRILYRREIDLERLQKWVDGDRTQVTSLD